jgi:hypothetical protein
VSLRNLPGWLQAFVKVSPVGDLVDAERGLMAGHPVAGQVVQALPFLAALVAAFAPVTARLYGR